MNATPARTQPVPRQLRVEPVMGTTVSIDLRGCTAQHARAATAAVVAWLHEVDAVFSTFRTRSAISRIARGETTAARAGGHVPAVLQRCEELKQATGGWFDAWANGVLDPSALVKGWAVEHSAHLLTGHGLTDFCLSAGGDIVCRGQRAPGLPWRIGIQHPRDRGAVAAVVTAGDLAVATSGCYERGAHITDPHSRRPPQGVLSVTVCGPDLGTADAYSTAAFAMGTDGPGWTAGLAGYEAMTVLADDTVHTTAGFPLLPATEPATVEPAQEAR